MKKNQERATFGAGCFWGVEDIFMKMDGVLETQVGFMGGDVPNPTYEQVGYENTGHVEVADLIFDKTKTTYRTLLDMFFRLHDPTEVDRQGADMGSQYRSVVFYHNDEQKKEIDEKIKELQESKKFNKPIVTGVEKASEFYRAEEYHQKYAQRTGDTSCIRKLA